MDRLLSFLLYAALFCLMKRFGCGAHLVHEGYGGHKHDGHEKAGNDSIKDPACRVTVESGQALGANSCGGLHISRTSFST
jgi:hypothetical protein